MDMVPAEVEPRGVQDRGCGAVAASDVPQELEVLVVVQPDLGEHVVQVRDLDRLVIGDRARRVCVYVCVYVNAALTVRPELGREDAHARDAGVERGLREADNIVREERQSSEHLNVAYADRTRYNRTDEAHGGGDRELDEHRGGHDDRVLDHVPPQERDARRARVRLEEYLF